MGEAAVGFEGDRSVLKFLLLVPPDHGDILARNGKTWLTFNEENKKSSVTQFLQEVLNAFAGTTPELLKLQFLQFPLTEAVNDIHRLSLGALCSSDL